jgi:hypothetical protein
LGISKNGDKSIKILGTIVDIVLIVIGVYIFVLTDIWIGWKIGIFVLIAAVVVLSWVLITKKIILRSPVITPTSLKNETAKYTETIQHEPDIEIYSKNELPRLPDLFSRTTNEIYFLGLTLESLRQVSTNIVNALRSNRKIRVLLLRPKPVFDEMVQRLTLTSHFSEGLNRTTYSLTILGESEPLTPAQKENLEVRMHDQIPSFSLILIDPYVEGSRYIQIEPYPFGISSGKRKVFVLSKNTPKQKDVIDLYLQAYNSLWTTAEPFNI